MMSARTARQREPVRSAFRWSEMIDRLEWPIKNGDCCSHTNTHTHTRNESEKRPAAAPRYRRATSSPPIRKAAINFFSFLLYFHLTKKQTNKQTKKRANGFRRRIANGQPKRPVPRRIKRNNNNNNNNNFYQLFFDLLSSDQRQLSASKQFRLGCTQFYSISMASNRFLMVFIEFYWVLRGSTWLNQVLLGSNKFNQVFIGFYGVSCVPIGFTKFLWGFTKFNSVVLSFTGFYWVLPGFTQFD